MGEIKFQNRHGGVCLFTLAFPLVTELHNRYRNKRNTINVALIGFGHRIRVGYAATQRLRS